MFLFGSNKRRRRRRRRSARNLTGQRSNSAAPRWPLSVCLSVCLGTERKKPRNQSVASHIALAWRIEAYRPQNWPTNEAANQYGACHCVPPISSVAGLSLARSLARSTVSVFNFCSLFLSTRSFVRSFLTDPGDLRLFEPNRAEPSATPVFGRKILWNQQMSLAASGRPSSVRPSVQLYLPHSEGSPDSLL